MPTFTFENTRIFFEEFGKGIPIVFIHPPAMGRKVFYFQLPLKDHFRVILPDLSGQGDTKGPVKEVSIFGFAKEIQALLDHLKIEKAVICGYSSGGLVAQEFALSFPSRTLAVILAGGFPEVRSITFRNEHLIGMYFVKKLPMLLAKVISGSHTTDSSLRDEMYRHMMKANRQMWYQFYEKSLHYSCVNRLETLTAPLFLIYGSRDLVNQHERIYKKYTSFQSAIIKKVAHQVPTKEWKLVNQLIIGFVQEKIEKAYNQKR